MYAKKILRTLAVALFWLAIWYAAARLAGSEYLFPDPLTVLARMGALALTGEFWTVCLTSLGRILLGVLAAVAVSVPLAVLTTAVPAANTLLSPLLTVVKSTPVASFIILALVWLGRETVPTFIAFLMVLPVVWGNVSAGIRNTDVSLLTLCRAYRVPRARVLLRLYVPSVAPHFTAAVQTALGLAWKAGVAAEVLTAAKTSIGKEIFEAKQYMETVNLFAWTLVVILLSLMIEKLVMALLSKVSRRQKEVLNAQGK